MATSGVIEQTLLGGRRPNMYSKRSLILLTKTLLGSIKHKLALKSGRGEEFETIKGTRNRVVT